MTVSDVDITGFAGELSLEPSILLASAETPQKGLTLHNVDGLPSHLIRVTESVSVGDTLVSDGIEYYVVGAEFVDGRVFARIILANENPSPPTPSITAADACDECGEPLTACECDQPEILDLLDEE